ncbi:MAG: hypothetical protein FJ148_27810 [Deltaproteobacteria bacterium]|nr:hypothetical protein [Deltaproteobacteria bacterium]
MRALGVAAVVGVDTDPVARASTLECAAANAVGAVRVLPSLGRVRGRHDVVTANLFAGLLVSLAAQLAARTKPGGHLIVAGLLSSQESEVQGALERAGFALLRRECRATWTVLTLVRAPHPEAGSATTARARSTAKSAARRGLRTRP